MAKAAKTEYPVLKLAIAQSKYSQREIANKIQINEKTFCNKLQGLYPFTWEEAMAIHKIFFSDIDIFHLFKKVERSATTPRSVG